MPKNDNRKAKDRQQQERKAQPHIRELHTKIKRHVLIDGWPVARVRGDPMPLRLERMKLYAIRAELQLPLFDGVVVPGVVKPRSWIRVLVGPKRKRR